MDFRPSQDRQMLADTLARLLADRYPIDARNRIAGSPEGFSRPIWNELAELGIIGALLPENAGGFGGTGFDIAIVFEAIGRALVVEPFLGASMASRVLTRSGGHEALLGDVIAGTRILAFAHEEQESRYDLARITTRAAHDSDGWMLTGHKTVVAQIEAADHLVVSAKVDDEIALFLLPADAKGVSLRGYPMIDGGRGGELSLDGVALPASARIAGTRIAAIEDAVAVGIVALCWEAVGIMEVLKAATLDYLRTRVQFGVPIGKFQALQHRMATVALEIEQMRSAAINAAAALDGEAWVRDRAASAAKFTVGRVGTLVAEEAIQMHGGIGMTWELPLSHYAKRLTMIGHQLGDEDHHLERFIALGRAA
jgi:alkylation response protein AidB-like acyl-CoA dehydrogenase